MVQTSSAPQPSRQLNNPRRNSWEDEEWDDMALAVYAVAGTTLSVPMRVNGRLEIHAMANLSGAGSLVINVDGVGATTSPSITGAGPLTAMWFADVNAGNHTITITSAAGLSNTIIMVRRGRKPPSI